jgi:hypothetical protein
MLLEPFFSSIMTPHTNDWMESLAKAVLLYHNGLFGHNADPEFERMVSEAPTRNPH